MKYNIPDRVMHDIFRFAQKNGITKVILFGSRARGTHTERSDIDLAVSGGNYLDFYYNVQEESHTLLIFDVVNLDQKISEELKKEIERDGVVIYGKA
ncbi:MAG: nucleotidyltransferase domain-containing protein [Clostridia bacterium]|nr:nucleotidyltransferase domain-containing protein [Clostridia bacterium]